MKELSKFFVFWVFALCMFTLVACGDGNNQSGSLPDLPDIDDTEQSGGSDEEIVGDIADIKEPILEFGKSMEYIKSKETRTFVGQYEDLSLVYTDGKHAKEINYAFLPNLRSVSMHLVDFSYESVSNFYKKNYILGFEDEKKKIAIFRDEDMTLSINLQLADDGVLDCILVAYYPGIHSSGEMP